MPARKAIFAPFALLAAGVLAAAGCAGTQRPPPGAQAPAPGKETPEVPGAQAEAAGKAGPGLAVGSGDRSAARDLFEQAVKRSDADPDGAASLFERAFEADPGLGFAAYDAGVLYERLDRSADAQSAYQRALRATPDFEPASLNLTRLRLRQGKASEAESELRARIAAYPSSLGLHNQLVEVLAATGRLDAAEQEARKILKSDEHNVPAMVSLAATYHAKKRHELAKMVLENARQLDPTEPAIWNRLAFVELALGNRSQALEDMKQAAALRQDYPEAHVNYGEMLVETEDYAGAVKELELAVKYVPRSPQAHLDLGNAYRGAKRFEDAQREYEKALALDPRLVDVHFNLGILYLDGDEPGLPALERIRQAMVHLDAFAATGGNEPRLAQYRKDAAVQLEKEKKRLAREEKDRLRNEAEAQKKAEAQMKADPAQKAPPGAQPDGGMKEKE